MVYLSFIVTGRMDRKRPFAEKDKNSRWTDGVHLLCYT